MAKTTAKNGSSEVRKKRTYRKKNKAEESTLLDAADAAQRQNTANEEAPA